MFAKLKEWFRTLLAHRRLLRTQEAQIVNLTTGIDNLTETISQLEQAIRCRDYALESLAWCPVEEKAVVRGVFRHKSYTQLQREFERQNSARFREIDARQSSSK